MSSQDFGLQQRKKPQPKITTPVIYETEEKVHSKTRVLRTVPKGSTIVCLILTAIALWTRLYKISFSDHVVWDEAHFGKFAGYYIKHTFYFDVHPPLGKMLNAFAGTLGGFNGKFEFESGAKYPEEVSYGVMRFFNGLFGAFCTPLAYWTAIHLRLSHGAAILLAVMTIVDNAWATITRFILLDAMLLFFTCFAVYCVCVFRTYQNTDVFSPEWFGWLLLSGVSLGLVSSVKWVGLFSIALVGLHTIEDLWELYGNIRLPLRTQIIHWGSRVVCLIIVPILVYMFSFVLHFAILNHSGPGDAQMSSLFQAGLGGNDFSSNPLTLAYGSKISLKNNARGGGLLHSHVQKFPEGSEQQQVTTYSHKDLNNEWKVEKVWGASDRNEDDAPEFVKDGDIIRLDAPVTSSDYEVSGYGAFNDTNDHWRVEKVDDIHDNSHNEFRSLTTRFRLMHVNLGCALRSDGVTLPEWGFKQGEVVCQKKPELNSKSVMWNIELHVNPKLPPGGHNAYKSSFLRDFMDLNVAMWSSNNALTPDPFKEMGQLESKPYHWPFLLRGLRICGWSDTDVKYYLLGNPFIWWSTTASLVGLLVTVIFYVTRQARGLKDFGPGSYDFIVDEWADFLFQAEVGLLGWFLHYIPFYIMGRVM
ncbi:Protein O-mannosyltransferase 2 [Terramyces sp. JEL0728]|nr:Protein O-mannosyltransferase 2 [Terramyces sp. JEL0728]